MKVLVTGAKGQLGKDLVQIFQGKENFEVIGLGREDLDITNQQQVNQFFSDIRPEVVIHSAAYTAVDNAEGEPDQAYLVNALGTRNLAIASEKYNGKFVYISTDYVFDGNATSPINEFETTNPIGVYGRSKLAGENFVRDFHSKYFIVRTSWVFGKYGNNFVKTMLKLASERDKLMVVHDQTGCPTYTVDLAKALLKVVETEKYGVYHISNSGSCTWYEFALQIFEEKGISIIINPCETKEFPRPAPRPRYSVFDHMSLRINNFEEMRHWKEALREFIPTLDS